MSSLILSITFLFMFISIMFLYILNTSHLLNSLLALEFMALILFYFINTSFLYLCKDMSLILYYIVMIVSESVLALSLLIIMTYNYSSDIMANYNLTKW